MDETSSSTLSMRLRALVAGARVAHRPILLVALLACLAMLAPRSGRAYVPTFDATAQANTYTVDRTDDPDPTAAMACTGAANDCSLRGAIMKANADFPTQVIINLPAGTYTLARAGRAEEDNSTGDLDIRANVTLVGNASDPGSTIVQAGTNTTNGIDRVIDINPLGDRLVTVTLQGLTVRYGYATDLYGTGISFWGCGSGGGTCNVSIGVGTLTVDHCIVSDNTGITGVVSGGGIEADQGNINIVSSTFTRNTAPNSGGGGVFASSNAGNLTITDSVIANNTCSGEGGGLYVNWTAPAGTARVQHTTISGNTSASRGGGASLYVNSGATAYVEQGCAITGNTSAGTGNNCAEGGGLYLAGPITVTGCTITGNNATAANGDNRGGGGIAVTNGTITISNCRITGNTAGTKSPDYLNPGTGLHIDSNGANVTAINNWWGCNGGPGSAGCDTAVKGTVGSYPGSTTLTSTPYLVLSLSASPTTVGTGGTSALTADLTHNSTGGTGFSVPDGTTATFAGTLGTASPASTTFTSGQATSTFTAGGSTGSGQGRVTVDSQTMSANITIDQPTEVTQHPTDQTACAGTSVSFTSTATGSPAPTVLWQYSTNGTTWNDITGATSTTYTHTAQASENGYRYRAAFTNTSGTVTSNPATLTVNAAPNVTQHPANQAVNSGASVSFTAAANGTPAPTVLWQYSANGTDWFDISGATSTTYTHTAQASESGYRYRAAFTNSCGTQTSNPATLSINVAPSMTQQPANQAVCAGASVSFTATAGGSPAPTVQWQYSTNGTTWTDVIGATLTTYTHTALAMENGYRYHAVFTNAAGTVTSDPATLTINPSTSATAPADQTLCPGGTLGLSTTASGTGPFSFVWKKGTTVLASGGNVTIVSDATTSSLSIANVQAADAGAYTVEVTGACSTASRSATLTVNESLTALDPADRTVCRGATASFSTTASGAGPFTFVWKKGTTVLSTGGNVTISTAGSTSDLALGNVQPGDAGTYTVEVTGACTTTTQSATLAVNTPPTVTTSPIAQTVSHGQTATFTTAANGTPAPTVQWQVSTNGTTWNDVTGATSTTYSFTASRSQDGYRYRAAFTNTCGDTQTTPVTLTVNKANTATTLTAAPNPSVYGQSVTFPAIVTSTAGTPSGAVTFMDGATPLATVPMDGSGHATLVTSILAAGTHSITATYDGDSSFNTSNAGVSQVINKAATTTALTAAVNPSVHGQSVTWTATIVVVAPGAGTPAGTVTFREGATTLGSGTLNVFGQATFTSASLAAGAHTITAEYAGNGNFAGSSGTLNQTVNQANTTTTLTASPNPSVFGQEVTLTAAVLGVAPCSVWPVGETVTFRAGSTSLGTATTDAAGSATLRVSSLAVGTHTVTAEYGGSANLAGSTAATAQTVNQASTATTVTSSANPSAYGRPITLTVTVQAVAPGAGAPTGSVTFSDGAASLGTRPLVGGVATLTTAGLAVGSHAITAVYAGDASFATSTGTLTQVVDKAATTLTLSSSTNPSVYGRPVTLTAAVDPVWPVAGPITGSVTLREGSTVLQTRPIVTGSVRFTLASPAIGTHTYTAEYTGNGTFAGASSTLNQDVLQLALGIHKTDGRAVWYASWNLQYTIVVSNTNPVPVAGVRVTDTLPVGMYCDTLPAGAQRNPDGSITWVLGTLGAGDVRTLTLTARTLSTVRGAIVNQAAVSFPDGDASYAGDTTLIVAPPVSPTSTPTPTSTPAPTATNTPTATPTATATATATPTATAPATPTTTPSAAPTATGSPTPKPGMGSILIHVWRDDNANGRQDEGETPLAGALVTLNSGGGQAQATRQSAALTGMTGEEGNFTFTNLAPGAYTVTYAVDGQSVVRPVAVTADDTARVLFTAWPDGSPHVLYPIHLPALMAE